MLGFKVFFSIVDSFFLSDKMLNTIILKNEIISFVLLEFFKDKADTATKKKAWKELCMMWHPDKAQNTGQQTEVKFFVFISFFQRTKLKINVRECFRGV